MCLHGTIRSPKTDVTEGFGRLQANDNFPLILVRISGTLLIFSARRPIWSGMPGIRGNRRIDKWSNVPSDWRDAVYCGRDLFIFGACPVFGANQLTIFLLHETAEG